MERQHVHSSRVVSIGWETVTDNLTGTLEVEFKGGSVYQYCPVSQQTYNKLIDSYQVGVDLQAIINDKGVVCTKQ